MSIHAFHPLLAFLLVGMTYGCATTIDDNSSIRRSNTLSDYPVTTVSATYEPTFVVELGGVNIPTPMPGISYHAPNAGEYGKTKGALMGASEGLIQCSPLLASGPFAFYIFIPCATLAATTGAIIGGATSAPKAEVNAFLSSSKGVEKTGAQQALIEKVQQYLSSLSDQPVRHAGEGVKGPALPNDYPRYAPSFGAHHGTLLEVSLLGIRYVGSGKRNDPICLNVSARARKIEATTGNVIDELTYDRTVECQTIDGWLTEGGLSFLTALEYGYQLLAEYLVDQLYLVYKIPSRADSVDRSTRTVPSFVLAPIQPPAPAVFLDFRGISKQDKYLHGWGGVHFVDVDNLNPTFTWESFPRAFDLPAKEINNVTYDFRLFSSRRHANLFVAEPATLLHESSGLTETTYSLRSALEPCSRYFWTVRARFNLNGSRRVTEWAGAYITAGGEVSPSHQYYYPFRTQGSVDSHECWK